MAFHQSVRTIARGKQKFRERLDDATSPLTRYFELDCPKYIRERISNIMKIKMSVRQDYDSETLFHFELLSPKQRSKLIDDILSIYSALLLDIGKMGDAFFGDPYKIIDNN
jgi:hypothetical protein